MVFKLDDFSGENSGVTHQQWICWKEHSRETIVFGMKWRGFCRFAPVYMILHARCVDTIHTCIKKSINLSINQSIYLHLGYTHVYIYIKTKHKSSYNSKHIYIYVWRMGLIGEFHELSLSIDVLYIPYGIQYSWETIRYSLFWLCNILDHFLCHCGFDNLEPLVPTLQHLVTPVIASKSRIWMWSVRQSTRKKTGNVRLGYGFPCTWMYTVHSIAM